MRELQHVFATGPAEVGISQSGNWWASGGTPAQTGTISFAAPVPKPTVPTVGVTFPLAPDDPTRDAGKTDDALTALVDRLTALLDTMPTVAEVAVQDRFLVLLDQQYQSLSGRLSGVLAAGPISGLLPERLSEWLQMGAIGMPPLVAQAIRDRAWDQVTRQAAQAERQISDEWAARGFSLPGGALVARLAIAHREAGDKAAELSRDTMIQEADWERDARKFGIDKGLQYDATLRDTFFKTIAQAQSIAQTWQEQHIKVALALVEVYKARIDAWGQAAQALGQMGNALGTVIKAKLDRLNGRIELYKAQIAGETSRADLLFKQLDAEIRLYTAAIEIEKERVGTQLKLEDQDIRLKELDTSKGLKEQEMALSKLMETAKITTSALDGIARTSSQLAAGALSALHMGASISAGSSISNGSSCSETYTYNF
ncbi:MAG: hypothetical protein WBO35_05675 [Candidatus Saccharimonadales bacterium]